MGGMEQTRADSLNAGHPISGFEPLREGPRNCHPFHFLQPEDSNRKDSINDLPG